MLKFKLLLVYSLIAFAYIGHGRRPPLLSELEHSSLREKKHDPVDADSSSHALARVRRSGSSQALASSLLSITTARSSPKKERAQGRFAELRESPASPSLSRRLLIATAAWSSLSQALAADELGWKPVRQMDVGRSALDAVEREFTPEFTAFLARFLISNEPETRLWWQRQKAEATSLANFVESTSLASFGEWGQSRDEKFLVAQLSSLIASVEVGLEKFGNAKGVAKLADLLKRRYKSPTQQRQLAQMFCLVKPDLQPVAVITSLLLEAQSARVANISVFDDDALKGESLKYTFATRDLQVNISQPRDGVGKTAKAKPVLRATGRWSAVRLVDGGSGYTEGQNPDVAIILKASNASYNEIRPAVVRATTRNGKVDALVLEDGGAGYISKDNSTPVSTELRIEQPSQSNLEKRKNETKRKVARGVLLPEYALIGFEIVDGGVYPADESPEVTVTERVDVVGLSGFEQKVYKFQVRTALRKDANESLNRSEMKDLQRLLSSSSVRRDLVLDPEVPPLPPALVPKFDNKSGIYRLPISIPPGALGRRGDAPVEKQPSLTSSDIGRLFFSGALGSGTAHTMLVPIDVIKTALQQNTSYAGPIECAKDLIAQGGPGSLLRGAGATLAAYASAGAVSFGLVEILGRALRGAAGPGIAQSFGLPVLILATALATAACSLVACPFEAIRVQSVKTGRPGVEVLQDILDNEGIGGLFRGLPPILLKEVPFVITKFVVFEAATEWLLSVAEDSGLVSPFLTASLPLAAGALAGMAAVFTSQPADAVFTLTNNGPGVSLASAVSQVQDEPKLILNGLSVRIVFGMLLVSLQFFFFTQLREALGISKEDLTLAWDALAFVRK